MSSETITCINCNRTTPKLRLVEICIHCREEYNRVRPEGEDKIINTIGFPKITCLNCNKKIKRGIYIHKCSECKQDYRFRKII